MIHRSMIAALLPFSIVQSFDYQRTAEHLLQSMSQHRYRAARNLFTRSVRRRMSASVLAAGWRSVVVSLGDDVEVGRAIAYRTEKPMIVHVPLRVGDRSLSAYIHFGDSDRVSDLQVRPSLEEWTPPHYAPVDVTDTQLVLRTPRTGVGATLTVPSAPTPPPVAILLMGGGPFDRDGTVGGNRIGRDIALGLAGAGIASIRYDKPSFVDPQLREDPAFTPSLDYLHPVLSSITEVRRRDDLDPSRIWLVGHSMGGRYAPRVASEIEGIAGLVLLAADAAPMQESATRVARHLAAQSDAPRHASAMVRRMERAAAVVNSDRLSLRTPRRKLPLNLSPGTWLELRDDDPVAVAARLTTPMLLLQGGRDYQVTEHDDLSRWRAGLTGKPNVEFRVLPRDDHFFFPGDAPSTPAGYESAQHVDPEAIRSTAAFIKAKR